MEPHVRGAELLIAQIAAGLRGQFRRKRGKIGLGPVRCGKAAADRLGLAPEMQIEGRRVDDVLDALLLKVEAPRQ